MNGESASSKQITRNFKQSGDEVRLDAVAEHLTSHSPKVRYELWRQAVMETSVPAYHILQESEETATDISQICSRRIPKVAVFTSIDPL